VASFRPEIAVSVRGGDTAEVEPDGVRMWLDGEEVTRDLEIGTNSLSFRPRQDLEPGLHRVRVRVRGADGQATEREWTFRVR
jgi:methionine-rich copper-binding protein CopC